MCGRSLFFTSYVETGYIEGICWRMKFIVPYTITMLQLTVDTLAQTRLLQRSSKRVSIGLFSSKMEENLP